MEGSSSDPTREFHTLAYNPVLSSTTDCEDIDETCGSAGLASAYLLQAKADAAAYDADDGLSYADMLAFSQLYYDAQESWGFSYDNGALTFGFAGDDDAASGAAPAASPDAGALEEGSGW